MTTYSGCSIAPLADAECKGILAALAGGKLPEAQRTDYAFLLAHCDDGVVWGRYDGGTWSLASKVYSGISPEPSEGNLQQLRLFGPNAELMIWRADEKFLGRVLADAAEPSEDYLKPMDGKLLLLADRRKKDPQQSKEDTKKGFTLVGDRAGARQAVPLEIDDIKEGDWPLRLTVKHYFEQDEQTGAVRIAVSRLVNLLEEK